MRKVRAEEGMFGGFHFNGSLATWIRDMREVCQGRFEPTPIQLSGIGPILEGKSIALMSPTGTGKTLAYLLPLWERLVERAPRGAGRGLRLLIITPSEDLMLQVGRILLQLAGPRAERNVLVLRRNLDRASARLEDALAVIATPKRLLEQLEMEKLESQWCGAARTLQAIVVDEADCMVPPGGARNCDLGEVLNFIRDQRQASPQLVLASASIDEYTLALMESSVNAEVEPIRAASSLEDDMNLRLAEEIDKVDDDEDSIDDRPWLWPQNLEHRIMTMQSLFEASGTISKSTITPIVGAICTLAPRRCLVVLSEKKAVAERGGSVGKYLYTLRRQLGSHGYQVATVSAAVEAVGSTDPGNYPWKQVLVGRCEAIRGLDLPGVDVVIIVGALNTSRDYMHMAGRTARWEAHFGGPDGGTVLSIVDNEMARVLKKWGRELGFRFDQLRLRSRNPRERE